MQGKNQNIENCERNLKIKKSKKKIKLKMKPVESPSVAITNNKRSIIRCNVLAMAAIPVLCVLEIINYLIVN